MKNSIRPYFYLQFSNHKKQQFESVYGIDSSRDMFLNFTFIKARFYSVLVIKFQNTYEVNSMETESTMESHMESFLKKLSFITRWGSGGQL